LKASGGRKIFRPKPNVEPLTIIKMIQAQPRVYALDGQDKVRFKMPLEGTAERLRAANDLLLSLGARKAA
jgi:transcription-repair coupling factor (superfamily II helicase)